MLHEAERREDGGSRRVLMLLAVDPFGIGGARIRGDSLAASAFASMLAESLEESAAPRTIASSVTTDRLVGGLDLAATVASSRPVMRDGVLGESDGRVLVLRRAGALTPECSAIVAASFENGFVDIERDGMSWRRPSRFVLLLEEDAEPVATVLADRVPISISLESVPRVLSPAERNVVLDARRSAQDVQVSPETFASLVEAASSLGIRSIRAAQVALRVARASAALAGRDRVAVEDLSEGLALAGAARPLMEPARDSQESARPDADGARSGDHPDPDDEATQRSDRAVSDVGRSEMTERIVAAARTRLSRSMLDVEHHASAKEAAGRGRSEGRARNARSGRSRGSRQRSPRAGDRLHFLQTIVAAAPLQPLRRTRAGIASADRIIVAPSDLRVRKLVARRQLTAIFVVDASGSMALRRLAEAKGAVEHLLAEGYARRDRVALVAFRGKTARVIIAPTRAPARARKALLTLPAGGGTPMAAALDAVRGLVRSARGEDRMVMALITDGHANIARDGSPGRARAAADARQSARLLARTALRSVIIDTSPRPATLLVDLQRDLGASHVVLPALSRENLAAAVGSTMNAAREADV